MNKDPKGIFVRNYRFLTALANRARGVIQQSKSSVLFNAALISVRAVRDYSSLLIFTHNHILVLKNVPGSVHRDFLFQLKINLALQTWEQRNPASEDNRMRCQIEMGKERGKACIGTPSANNKTALCLDIL